MDNNISYEMIQDILTNEQFWQKYQEDIEQHYNIQDCLENQDKLSQNMILTGYNAQGDCNICEGLFLALAQPLSILKIIVQEAAVQQFISEEFLLQFNRINNAQKQSKFFINEFMDQLVFYGLKNIKNSIKKNTGLKQQKQTEYDEQDEQKQQLKQQKIIEQQFEFFLDQSNDILLPKDHKKYSSCMLIRSHSQSQNQQQKIQEDEDKQLQQKLLEGSLISMSSDFTDVGLIKDEIQKSNTLNIIQMFLGDIQQHRYLQDNKYIENHLYTAQCEKYKPQMTCIYESEEENGNQQTQNNNLQQINYMGNIQKKQKQQNMLSYLDDSYEENQDDSQQQEEEYWEQINEYRIQFQQILKKIIEIFNSFETQKVLKEIYENIQKTMIKKILEDQESVKANKQQFLAVSIENYYSINKAYNVVNKIQKLVKKQIPNYSSYIDFKEFQLEEEEINKQRKKNMEINLQDKKKLGSSINLEDEQKRYRKLSNQQEQEQYNQLENINNQIISEQELLDTMQENNISGWMFY